MQLGIAHVAEIPEQVCAHAKNDVPQGSVLAAAAQLLQLIPDELLVVEVAFAHLGRQHLVEHLGGVEPLLVRERAAHHVAPELTAVGGLGSGPDVGEAAEGEGDERDEGEDSLCVAGVERGGEGEQRAAAETAEGGAQEDEEAQSKEAEGAAEEDAEGDGAAEDGGGPDREGVHCRLVGDVHGSESDPNPSLPPGSLFNSLPLQNFSLSLLLLWSGGGVGKLN